MGVHVKKMAILEKKLDRPSGTLGCPIDEFARLLGIWYVLGGGRSVAWALQAHCGVKKRLSARAQNRGCGKLKTIGPIRLEGVKKYPSGYSHFFTGCVRFVGGPGPSAPQWARFRLLALWRSAVADGGTGAGQAQPGPSSTTPPVPLSSPQPAVQASRVAVGPGKGLTSMLAPHEARATEACQNIPVLPVLTDHPYLIK